MMDEILSLRRQIKEERQAANILLRDVRAKVIEECALLVAERAIWTSDRDIRDVLIAVAAAIRALKDKP